MNRRGAWVVSATLLWGVARATTAQVPAPAHGARTDRWTLGSPARDVRRIEGEPDRVDRLTSLGYETWRYGAAWVRVGLPSEDVVGWSNPDERLAVVLPPGRDTTTQSAVALGSRISDVLRLRGTPSLYLPDRRRGAIVLSYGRSPITIDAASRRVTALAVVAEGEPAAGATSAVGVDAPPLPLSLRADATLLSDGHGGRVEADDELAFEVRVHNDGPGVARGLRLRATAPGVAMRSSDAESTVDALAAGATRALPLRLHVDNVPRDTTIEVDIAIAEAQHFDLDPPLGVRIPLTPARAPRLTLTEVAAFDPSGNGRIEPREVVDVVARIQNGGEGIARDVRIRIIPGDGVHLTPGTATEQRLGALAPHGARDVRFTAFSDSRAAGFPVSLEVREQRGRYDTTFVLPLALNRPQAGVAPLLRPATERAEATGPLASLVSRVDTGVPRAPLRPGAVAVVLGIERYARAPDAAFAQRDAATFRVYAERLLGIGADAGRLFYATNEDVSRSTLHKLFDPDGWVARRTDSTTDLVVFIAAHGTVDVKSRAAYLLPSDADPAYPVQTGVALDTMLERLGALPTRSVTVFLDACFSGMTRDGGALVPWTRDVGVSIEHPALKHAHMAVFTASTGSEFSLAWPQQRHGLFTYWLLDGMRGAADANGDRAVTASELGAYLAPHVRETAAHLGREQSPQLVTRDRDAVIVRLPEATP